MYTHAQTVLYALVYLASLTGGQRGCTNTDYCLVDCSGCQDVWTRIPDPSNCKQYYFCNKDELFTTQPMKCPYAFVFKPENSSCQFEHFCLAPCDRIERCHYTCYPDSQHYLVADRVDCSTYHVCSPNRTEIVETRRCTITKPFFNGIYCQENITECCNCQPYCSNKDLGSAVVDPLDCRRYFECWVVGIPFFVSHCPNGTYFNTTTGTCNAETTCELTCANNVGSDGCIAEFVCLQVGYFPKCVTHLSRYYYYCPAAHGKFVKASACFPGFVFLFDLQGCVPESEV
ncbi:uncharacterized protein LOC123505034 [Portunus trituberculatus]|uniref:uncharacterized protein LOC123505034 n=1 Tax=Portunus trituberculatus TaxID=210409 RepID=UPI001E1CCB57|nr:uncharacterized protein LOC123505034 [Portunus trituberculatus]